MVLLPPDLSLGRTSREPWCHVSVVMTQRDLDDHREILCRALVRGDGHRHRLRTVANESHSDGLCPNRYVRDDVLAVVVAHGAEAGALDGHT